MLIAVNYHYVRPSYDDPHDGIHGITPATLDRQLELLSRAASFVSIDEVADAAGGGRALPRRALLVTFDDGLREQVEHALPVLERRGVPAVFFVNTAPVVHRSVSTVHKIHLLRARTPPAELNRGLREAAEAEEIELPPLSAAALAAAHEQYRYDEAPAARLKYLLNFILGPDEQRRTIDRAFADRFPGREAAMSEELYVGVEELRQLAGRGGLGTHAHEHVALGRLNSADAERQIATSLALLQEWTGRRPRALSYPFGGREACGPTAAEAAARAGVELAFTTERAGNDTLDHPLLLARFNCNDLPGGKRPLYALAGLFETVEAASRHHAAAATGGGGG